MFSTLLGCFGCRTVDDRPRREAERLLRRGYRVLQRLLRPIPSMDQDSNAYCCLLLQWPIVSRLVIADGLSRRLPVSLISYAVFCLKKKIEALLSSASHLPRTILPVNARCSP